jgi:hypothetical protein
MVKAMRAVADPQFLQARKEAVSTGAYQNLPGVFQQDFVFHAFRCVGEVASPTRDMGVADPVDVALMGGDMGGDFAPDPGETAEQSSG